MSDSIFALRFAKAQAAGWTKRDDIINPSTSSSSTTVSSTSSSWHWFHPQTGRVVHSSLDPTMISGVGDANLSAIVSNTAQQLQGDSNNDQLQSKIAQRRAELLKKKEEEEKTRLEEERIARLPPKLRERLAKRGIVKAAAKSSVTSVTTAGTGTGNDLSLGKKETVVTDSGNSTISAPNLPVAPPLPSAPPLPPQAPPLQQQQQLQQPYVPFNPMAQPFGTVVPGQTAPIGMGMGMMGMGSTGIGAGGGNLILSNENNDITMSDADQNQMNSLVNPGEPPFPWQVCQWKEKVYYWHPLTDVVQFGFPKSGSGAKSFNSLNSNDDYSSTVTKNWMTQSGRTVFDHEEIVQVTENDLGRVIGKGGNNIKMLQNSITKAVEMMSATGGQDDDGWKRKLCAVILPKNTKTTKPDGHAPNGKPVWNIRIQTNDKQICRRGRKVIDLFLATGKKFDESLKECGFVVEKVKKKEEEEGGEGQGPGGSSYGSGGGKGKGKKR